MWTSPDHVPSLTVSTTSSFPLRPFPSATMSLNLYIPSTRLERRSTAWWSLLLITSYNMRKKKKNQKAPIQPGNHFSESDYNVCREMESENCNRTWLSLLVDNNNDYVHKRKEPETITGQFKRIPRAFVDSLRTNRAVEVTIPYIVRQMFIRFIAETRTVSGIDWNS